MERVKVKLRQTLNKDFQVTVEHREEQTGDLPPLPAELDASFRNWQSTYRQVEQVRSCISPKPGLRSTATAPKLRIGNVKVTHHSGSMYATAVKSGLNEWLDANNSRWQSLREYLIRSETQVPILLDVDDIQLQHLPWQEWDLLETCNSKAEFVLRVKGHPGDAIKPPHRHKRVRILVVVGRSENIRTLDDLDVVKKLEAKGAEVVSLIQPLIKELCEALWDKQGYHMFVFTGHSGSQADGQIGWIEVNEHDSLEIGQFKRALKAAIDRGLQLAIFNSCDGLGLANQLAKLNLPRSIVMREPVPDEVAVEFLRHFFDYFSENHSLVESVRKAREKLEHFNVPSGSEHFYPGVMWLPTLCTRQSALDVPLTWKGLIRDPFLSNVGVKSFLAGVVAGGTAVALAISLFPRPSSLSPYLFNAGHGGSVFPISVDGSSTVEPITKTAADSYRGRNTFMPEIKVDISGTGGGFQKFCNGATIINDASRPISSEEKALCEQNDIDYVELPIARDAITVMVHPENTWAHAITLQELTKIWHPEAEDTITRWSDIRPDWPNLEVVLYGPGQDSGTFDYFTELLTGEAGLSRTDYVDSEDDDVLVSGVRERINSLGYVGYAYYQQNASELKAVRIIGEAGPVLPDVSTIADGSYPLSRPLFIYVNTEIAQQRADVREFIEYYLENATDFVNRAGYFPLSDQHYREVLDMFKRATHQLPVE